MIASEFNESMSETKKKPRESEIPINNVPNWKAKAYDDTGI